MIINSREYRCDAAIVRSQGDLVLVILPNITAAELESLANQQEEFASRKSKSVWIPSKGYCMPSETLEQVLNRTWALVGEPITQKFKELGVVRESEGSSKSQVWWSHRITLFSPHSCLISTNKTGYCQYWNDGYSHFILYTHIIYSSSSSTTKRTQTSHFSNASCRSI